MKKHNAQYIREQKRRRDNLAGRMGLMPIEGRHQPAVYEAYKELVRKNG